MLNSPGVLRVLSPEAFAGIGDPLTFASLEEKTTTEDELRRRSAREEMPASKDLVLVLEFED